MNLSLLTERIESAGITLGKLADRIGVPRSTFYRKIKEDDLTCEEAKLIAHALNLSNRDTILIFFPVVPGTQDEQ